MNDLSIPFLLEPQPAARSPDLFSGERTADRGPRAAVREFSYCVFVPLAPAVIGVTTTFRNHTSS